MGRMGSIVNRKLWRRAGWSECLTLRPEVSLMKRLSVLVPAAGSVVAWARNSRTQQRRGMLRGSVVPSAPYMCACRRVCACVHACGCVSPQNHTTTQLCRRAAACAVTRALNRATPFYFSLKRKKGRGALQLARQMQLAPSPRVGSFQAGLPYGANRSRNRSSEWAGNSLTAGANRVTHASQN